MREILTVADLKAAMEGVPDEGLVYVGYLIGGSARAAETARAIDKVANPYTDRVYPDGSVIIR